MRSEKATASAWRNRITGHGEEAPDQLLANPRNWRIHPQAQQDALAAVLDRAGWVQDVIVNQRTGHVVDGHARIALAVYLFADGVHFNVRLEEDRLCCLVLVGVAWTAPRSWSRCTMATARTRSRGWTCCATSRSAG